MLRRKCSDKVHCVSGMYCKTGLSTPRKGVFYMRECIYLVCALPFSSLQVYYDSMLLQSTQG